jgi:hypothetical protein
VARAGHHHHQRYDAFSARSVVTADNEIGSTNWKSRRISRNELARGRDRQIAARCRLLSRYYDYDGCGDICNSCKSFASQCGAKTPENDRMLVSPVSAALGL